MFQQLWQRERSVSVFFFQREKTCSTCDLKEAFCTDLRARRYDTFYSSLCFHNLQSSLQTRGVRGFVTPHVFQLWKRPRRKIITCWLDQIPGPISGTTMLSTSTWNRIGRQFFYNALHTEVMQYNTFEKMWHMLQIQGEHNFTGEINITGLAIVDVTTSLIIINA